VGALCKGRGIKSPFSKEGGLVVFVPLFSKEHPKNGHLYSKGIKGYDCMDAGGRATQETKPRGDLGDCPLTLNPL